ncbi:unnamed protein product [Lampetra planeri]
MASQEFTVLYTHQKTKKAKAWQDGILRTHGNGGKAILFDDKGLRLDSVFLKGQKVTVGLELESDRFLITVEESTNPTNPLVSATPKPTNPEPPRRPCLPSFKRKHTTVGFVAITVRKTSECIFVVDSNGRSTDAKRTKAQILALLMQSDGGGGAGAGQLNNSPSSQEKHAFWDQQNGSKIGHTNRSSSQDKEQPILSNKQDCLGKLHCENVENVQPHRGEEPSLIGQQPSQDKLWPHMGMDSFKQHSQAMPQPYQQQQHSDQYKHSDWSNAEPSQGSIQLNPAEEPCLEKLNLYKDKETYQNKVQSLKSKVQSHESLQPNPETQSEYYELLSCLDDELHTIAQSSSEGQPPFLDKIQPYPDMQPSVDKQFHCAELKLHRNKQHPPEEQHPTSKIQPKIDTQPYQGKLQPNVDPQLQQDTLQPFPVSVALPNTLDPHQHTLQQEPTHLDPQSSQDSDLVHRTVPADGKVFRNETTIQDSQPMVDFDVFSAWASELGAGDSQPGTFSEDASVQPAKPLPEHHRAAQWPATYSPVSVTELLASDESSAAVNGVGIHAVLTDLSGFLSTTMEPCNIDDEMRSAHYVPSKVRSVCGIGGSDGGEDDGAGSKGVDYVCNMKASNSDSIIYEDCFIDKAPVSPVEISQKRGKPIALLRATETNASQSQTSVDTMDISLSLEEQDEQVEEATEVMHGACIQRERLPRWSSPNFSVAEPGAVGHSGCVGQQAHSSQGSVTTWSGRESCLDADRSRQWEHGIESPGRGLVAQSPERHRAEKSGFSEEREDSQEGVLVETLAGFDSCLVECSRSGRCAPLERDALGWKIVEQSPVSVRDIEDKFEGGEIKRSRGNIHRESRGEGGINHSVFTGGSNHDETFRDICFPHPPVVKGRTTRQPCLEEDTIHESYNVQGGAHSESFVECGIVEKVLTAGSCYSLQEGVILLETYKEVSLSQSTAMERSILTASPWVMVTTMMMVVMEMSWTLNWSSMSQRSLPRASTTNVNFFCMWTQAVRLSELRFPSMESVLRQPTLKRKIIIPVSFSSPAAYKDTLSSAIIEHLNLILHDTASRLHRKKIGGPGSRGRHVSLYRNSVDDFVATASTAANNNVYAADDDHDSANNFDNDGDYDDNENCNGNGDYFNPHRSVSEGFGGRTLVQRFRKKKFVTEEMNSGIKRKLFLLLNRKENHSSYSKDDLWVISTDAGFPPASVMVVCSVFYGPSASGELEVSPLREHTSSTWPQNATVHAIHVCNASWELSCLRNIRENVEVSTLPILPLMLSLEGSQERSVKSRRTGFRPPLALAPPAHGSWVDPAQTWPRELAERTIAERGLNGEQGDVLRRVAHMIQAGAETAGVTIVQGVFGAGKSFMLSCIVMYLIGVLRRVKHEAGTKRTPLRVLISAATNVAVDRVLLGLLDLGFEEFVRVGSIKKIAKPILPFSLHAGSGNDSDQLRELQSLLKEQLSPAERVFVKRSIETHKLGRNRNLLKEVSVVGATCASCPFPSMGGLCFPFVILDECSQITEPMSLLPIARFGCERLLLVGDPRQLPPTVQGSEPEHESGLEQTLFTRLKHMGHPLVQLRTQYRCHPHISLLAASLFYQGELRDGVGVAERPSAAPWLPTLTFLDVPGQEKVDTCGSYYNKAEVDAAVKLVDALVESRVEPEDIAVITLYRAQAARVHECLASLSGSLAAVRVCTADAFQGGEVRVCVLSIVRSPRDSSSSFSSSSFVESEQRACVALTRARGNLVVLGCATSLGRGALWGRVLKHCQGACSPQASRKQPQPGDVDLLGSDWESGDEKLAPENDLNKSQGRPQRRRIVDLGSESSDEE